MRWMFGLLVVGCNGDSGEDGAVDFASDVRPLLADSCARCHGESGLGAGLDFLDYDTAAQWAEVMVDRIDAGTMPPPQADPECHPYRDDDLGQVDPALRDTLAAWIDAGKPEGDLASAPEVHVREPATLSNPDEVLRSAAPITPDFVDGNEYRCFLIDDDVDADTWITGMEFLIDHPAISHHGLLFIDTDGGSESLITDPASRSWTCPSVFPRPEWYPIHAWAPSGGAVEFPEGLGLKLEAHQQLIMQLHYYEGTTGAVADQPGYALKLADSVSRQLYYAPFGPDRFTIPAGDAAYTATDTIPMSYLYGLSVDVYGVMPHMHLLGSGYDFHATNADGTETCISRSDAYDFSNQPTYWFDSPVFIDGSSTVSISCTWDNSAANPNQQFDPPVDVGWGENTQEEMCFALMYVGLH